jgi:hypothetical protein
MKAIYRNERSTPELFAEIDALRERVGGTWCEILLGDICDTKPAEWMRKIPDGASEIDIEMDHVFENQFNTVSGLRLYDFVCVRPITRGRRGPVTRIMWLQDIDALNSVRASIYKCGYCGAQHDATGYCHKCLGSRYLTRADLHLLNLAPVLRNTARPDIVTDEMVAAYEAAQAARTAADNVKAREKVLANYESACKNAQIERDGKLFLMDRGLPIDDVIYYSHTNKFQMGWHYGADPETIERWRAVVGDDFPGVLEYKSK